MDEEAKAALLGLKNHLKLPKINTFLLMVGVFLKENNNSTISRDSVQGNLFIRHIHALTPQNNPHFMTQSTITQLSSEPQAQPSRKKYKLDIQKK